MNDSEKVEKEVSVKSISSAPLSDHGERIDLSCSPLVLLDHISVRSDLESWYLPGMAVENFFEIMSNCSAANRSCPSSCIKVLATLRLQGCCHMVHCRVFDESLLGVGATLRLTETVSRIFVTCSFH